MGNNHINDDYGTDIARTVAHIVQDISFDRLTRNEVDITTRHVLDTVGVTMAGAVERAGAIAGTAVLGDGDPGEQPASVIGFDDRSSCPNASFINGISAHTLDFDDVSMAISGHPSVTIVPSLLAVAEARNAGGKDVIESYVAGYETLCRLVAPVKDAHYERGWHTTATFGPFGAAAAVSRLLDLGVDETATAIAIAASTAAGLRANFGTMTKPMHAGQAARSGTTAALLAADGFTANQDALSGNGGFYDLYGGTDDPDMSALGLGGDELAIGTTGRHIKKYPCCAGSHSAIDATLRLRGAHGITADDVDSIRVEASESMLDVLSHAHPTTELEAKFSMHYAIARAIIDGEIRIETFADARFDSEAVTDLIDAVEFVEDPSLPYYDLETTVAIRTTSGETYEETVHYPDGTSYNPMSDAAFSDKFVDAATQLVDGETARALYEELIDLESIDDMDGVLRGL